MDKIKVFEKGLSKRQVFRLYILFLEKVDCLSKEERAEYLKYIQRRTNPPLSIPDFKLQE